MINGNGVGEARIQRMYFFFYALLTAALFIFSGIGFAILITPRVFEKYSLYFSPFVGLAYLSFCSWLLFEYSAMGTNHYAKFLLIPPLLFLAIAAIVKKDRIVPIVFPFTKEHLMVLFICVILFLSIAYPYYSKIDGVSNTITLGNNDIVDYAATSKYLTTSSFTHPDSHIPFRSYLPLVHGGHAVNTAQVSRFPAEKLFLSISRDSDTFFPFFPGDLSAAKSGPVPVLRILTPPRVSSLC